MWLKWHPTEDDPLGYTVVGYPPRIIDLDSYYYHRHSDLIHMMLKEHDVEMTRVNTIWFKDDGFVAAMVRMGRPVSHELLEQGEGDMDRFPRKYKDNWNLKVRVTE